MTKQNEQEELLLKKYGTKPKKSSLLQKRLGAGKERQHFDSADYEMQKEGKNPVLPVR